MGCKQTTTKPLPVVFTAVPTSPTSPIYVKSALKKTGANGIGKTEKLSILKRKPTTSNKSVNFDENVRVKLRTPTLQQTRYEHSINSGTRQTSNDDNDDDNNSDRISSSILQEDIDNEQFKTSIIPPTLPLQRNQPNGFRFKNNSVAVLSSTNNIKEKIQQPPVNMTIYPPENPNIPIGNRFRVRRKVQNSVLPQTSDSIDLNQSSSTPPFSSHRSTVQSPPLPIERPLSNTNTVLIEHRAPVPFDGSSSQPTYYAFSRRPADKNISTEK